MGKQAMWTGWSRCDAKEGRGILREETLARIPVRGEDLEDPARAAAHQRIDLEAKPIGQRECTSMHFFSWQMQKRREVQ